MMVEKFNEIKTKCLRHWPAMRRLLPSRLVDRLLPVQLGTIGRECNLTNWSEEWTTRDA